MKRFTEKQIDEAAAAVTVTLLEAAPDIHPLDLISVFRSALLQGINSAPSEKIKRQLIDQTVILLRDAQGPKQDPAFKKNISNKISLICVMRHFSVYNNIFLHDCVLKVRKRN